MPKTLRLGMIGLALAGLIGCQSPAGGGAGTGTGATATAPKALAEQRVRELFADSSIDQLTMESVPWRDAKDRIQLNTPELKPEDTVWLAHVVGKLKPRFKSSVSPDLSASEALVVVAGPEAKVIGGRFAL